MPATRSRSNARSNRPIGAGRPLSWPTSLPSSAELLAALPRARSRAAERNLGTGSLSATTSGRSCGVPARTDCRVSGVRRATVAASPSRVGVTEHGHCRLWRELQVRRHGAVLERPDERVWTSTFVGMRDPTLPTTSARQRCADCARRLGARHRSSPALAQSEDSLLAEWAVAALASSVRLETPIFRKMWETWVSTVRLEMNS